MRNQINHLPTDIILDIITRLPAESILDCKLVCKPWRNLVSHNPSFYQMYLSHLNHSPDSGKLSFLVSDIVPNRIYYFDYDENNEESPIDSIRRINMKPPFSHSDYYIFGSINGLVYLYGLQDNTTCICNPVTKEYVMLPGIKRHCDDYYVHYASGFGYDSIKDEYKVVQLCKLRSNFIKVAVYTLGSGKVWRIVGRLDYKICKHYADLGVFANGALHWVDKVRGRVLAFNLAKEKFCDEPLPPPPNPRYGAEPFGPIGNLGGDLYYVTTNYDEVTSDSDDDGIIEDRCLDIWMLKKKNGFHDMKEQVEDEPLGWIKEFSLLEREPVAFTKSGGVLCANRLFLDIYDPITSTSKRLVSFSTYGEVFPHKNTIVSIKELGEEDIKTMEAAEVEETESRDLTPKLQAR